MPFPNRVHAFDLNAPERGPKWTYEAHPEARAPGVACCDVVNRGAAYDGGRLFFNTLDNHTVALDADTGRELWNVKLGDVNRGETMTMAPLVVKDRVLVGNSGGEMGVRGWLTALDTRTGELAWRAYSTGPDPTSAKPCTTSAQAPRVPRIGNRWPSRPALPSSTFRTITWVRTKKACRRTTSPARPTSARQ